MSTRVKNLDKITKELLSQINLWEESRGAFMFAVRKILKKKINNLYDINKK